MSSPITQAIKQICEEKNLTYESVLETVESALASAYRKDFGEKNQNLKAEFDPETGRLRVFDVKTVVSNELFEEYEKEMEERAKLREEQMLQPAKPGSSMGEEIIEPKETLPEDEKPKFNPKLNISLAEAKKLKKTAKIDDVITTELTIPSEFGRMAAQTAKQVITQKLREAERENIFSEYKDKEGQVLSGVVQRREGRVVLIDLGRTVAVMPPEGQVPTEQYKSGERIKVYVTSVAIGTRGPEINVSRSHPELVKKLFTSEIPEIADGAVVIHEIAREAGSRSKVAVSSKEENVDPVGSCIGQRGTRIQTIINELGGEKIDIIEYDSNPEKFIAKALAPAKIQKIQLNEAEKTAIAHVMPDQFSLAIGRSGQNVRLAAHLSGWKITVQETKEAGETAEAVSPEETEKQTETPVLPEAGDKKTKKVKEEAVK